MNALAGTNLSRIVAEHTLNVIARRIAARTDLRTGARSRKRGRTIHVRPKVSGCGIGPGLYTGRMRIMRRGGPVAGCTPRQCWHKYPHAPMTPAGIAVWDRPVKS